MAKYQLWIRKNKNTIKEVFDFIDLKYDLTAPLQFNAYKDLNQDHDVLLVDIEKESVIDYYINRE